MTRKEITRPILIAMAFTITGEFLILLFWGLIWFPGGPFLVKLVWTVTCGVAMGATAGALVVVGVTGRMTGTRAALVSGAILFAVLSYCTLLCFGIDRSTGARFGSVEASGLFLAGGLGPAFLSSLLYGWLLYIPTGQRVLKRLGL